MLKTEGIEKDNNSGAIKIKNNKNKIKIFILQKKINELEKRIERLEESLLG